MEKVLFCASTASHLKNFHLPYLKEFKGKGYKVYTLTDSHDSIEYSDVTKFIPFKKKIISFSNLKAITCIKHFLEKEKFDIIITHTALAGFLTRMAVRFMKNRPKLIHMVHGYLFKDTNNIKDKLYLFCEKICSKVTDSLIVMNNEDYEIARKYKLYKENLYYTDGIGIELERFRRLETDKRDFGIKESDIVFLNVGEFSKRKNQELLIRTFYEVKDRIKNGVIVFAGEGKEMDNCKKICKDLKIEDRVHFMGNVEKIEKLYNCCDYFVSAAKSEGMPVSVIEAAAAEMPLILSDIKGHREIVKDIGGKLFELKKEELKKALLLSDIVPRQKFEINLEKYSIGKIKDKIMKIYCE